MNNIHLLQPSKRRTPISDKAKIRPGCRYSMSVPESPWPEHAKEDIGSIAHGLQSGVIGAYRLGINAAEIEAVDLNASPVQGFVWDTDLLTPAINRCLQTASELSQSVQHNRLTLVDATLEGPEVIMVENRPTLTITPRFKLEWLTEAFASQLGVVQLVESSRTLHFADGESQVLLDTEAVGPALYLSDATGALAVKPVCAYQRQGGRQLVNFSTGITQDIPAAFQNKPVASVSVLEKYTVYFMQNAAPDDTDRHIWVPVHLPIVWGWSIRVQQRFDGVWDIFRKKLVMPTPSTEAAALPRWKSNSLQCQLQPFSQG